MAEAAVYLDSCLAPLADLLAQEDITDIYINRPGEVFIERLGGDIEKQLAPALTAPALERLARQVAASTAQGVSRQHPLLAAALPDGSRIQIILPPATRGEPALAIRKHVSARMSLDDFDRAGAFTAVSAVAPERAGEAEDASPMNEQPSVSLLRKAVLARRNILISGGTSSGKTTFLNALIKEIPQEERLILIEDTPELLIGHPNAIGLLAVRGQLGEADVSAEDLLIASLRMRPDRIILGEIRGNEAQTFLRAINTGHPGSLSTIHADSPQRAIDQLSLLVLQTGSKLSWDAVQTYIKSSIDLIVQLSRLGNVRHVSAIMM